MFNLSTLFNSGRSYPPEKKIYTFEQNPENNMEGKIDQENFNQFFHLATHLKLQTIYSR